MDMKKTVRKMSAVLTGATMIGATVMGAMALDLSNYPSPFIQDGFFEGKIVIGEKAQPIDTIGATDIAAAMQADAVTPVGTGGSVEVAGGKTEEIAIGSNLNAGMGATLDNNDVAALKEGTVTIDINGIDDEYDYHDEIRFTTDARLDTGLTATKGKEDFKDGVYLLLQQNAIGYYYVFDDALANGNFMTNASDDEPITIDFLGKELEIIDATASSLTVQVGETVYMDAAQKVTVSGKEVTLVRVGDTSAIVSVGGVQQQINVGATKTVGGLRIKVKETFNDEGVTNDAATLIVGTESTKTYDNSDPFIGENEDDPNWVWDLSGLDGATPTIGITWDRAVASMIDEPITIGESLSLPNDYAKVELVSLNQNDNLKYTVSTGTKNLYYGASETSGVDVLLFKSDGTEEDTFKINGEETSEIAVAFNSTSNELDFFYKDNDDANKYKYAGVSSVAALANSANLFTLEYKDSSVTVDWANGGAATNGTFVVDEESVLAGDAKNLNFFVELTAGAIDHLGHSDGDSTTTGDVFYGTKDISGWEEDTLTDHGVTIYSYDASASADELSFAIPQEISDFKVNVAVVGGAGAATHTSGSGSYRVNPLPTGSTILDKDALNLLGTDTPLIVVGGPSVNTVAAELMGNPTREQINTLFSAGTAKIKFYAAQNALLVAGYEGQDTLGACYVLKDYAEYDLTGTEVEVVVPSLSSISVRTPQ